tara:strand:- start:277 stop:540 length:264 start_codon:yes stop_codon:yes gene_type:complete
MSKKITLKSGVKATLIEMSVDAFDKCMDSVRFEKVDGQSVIKNQFALSTLWIRNGVDGADDKFIKSLSINDRVELQLAIQEYNSLGE